MARGAEEERAKCERKSGRCKHVQEDRREYPRIVRMHRRYGSGKARMPGRGGLGQGFAVRLIRTSQGIAKDQSRSRRDRNDGKGPVAQQRHELAPETDENEKRN